MSNWTFFTQEQCLGDQEKNIEPVDIIKKRGTKAAITDMAILQGGYSYDYYVDYDKSSKGRTGRYWMKSDNGSGGARVIDDDGYCYSCDVFKRSGGARPASTFSSINDICTNGASAKKNIDGIYDIPGKYFPQYAVDYHRQIVLEDAYKKYEKYKNNSLMKKVRPNYYPMLDENLSVYYLDEYEYKGKRYVRYKVDKLYKNNKKLSNGECYNIGDIVWLECERTNIWADEKDKMWTFEKIYWAGIAFDNKSGYKEENFDKTYIKQYMDKYLVPIMDPEIPEKIDDTKTEQNMQKGQESNRKKTRIEKLNPDSTPVEERRKMTDTELIWDWIKSGQSVLLRGPSGIGKTERIREFGKKGLCEVIELKLTKDMFPEKVVGSTNLQTGEEIPPSYIKTIMMEMATEEEKKLIEENIQNIFKIADTIYERSKKSDKKIVILLDELLNVPPATQSLVYTLVLNRIAEIGKGIKLPKNVVIVATGNPKKYSSAAYDLAKPLQQRFDHIYDMKAKVGEWLTEYAIPNKIHPKVIGYIMTKYMQSGQSEKTKDIGYFYEEPEVGEENLDENGCPGKTCDPRGWTSISESLYNFEESLKNGEYIGKDVEDILQRSLGSKLRMEWATDFYEYYNKPTITPEEVMQGKGKGYTEADLPRDIGEQQGIITALVSADETQVEACRNFIKEYCDKDYLGVYDIYWAGNDERKMNIIAELQNMDILLDTSTESEQYAEDGVQAYGAIGEMYQAFKREKDMKMKDEAEEGNAKERKAK